MPGVLLPGEGGGEAEVPPVVEPFGSVGGEGDSVLEISTMAVVLVRSVVDSVEAGKVN